MRPAMEFTLRTCSSSSRVDPRPLWPWWHVKDFTLARRYQMISRSSCCTFGVAFTAVMGIALAAGLSAGGETQGQPAVRAGKSEPIPGLSRQPSPAAREVLLDPSDTVMLLLDHQTGLFQTVKDVPVAELRNNTVALANIAKLGKAPIIYTASEPNGP